MKQSSFYFKKDNEREAQKNKSVAKVFHFFVGSPATQKYFFKISFRFYLLLESLCLQRFVLTEKNSNRLHTNSKKWIFFPVDNIVCAVFCVSRTTSYWCKCEYILENFLEVRYNIATYDTQSTQSTTYSLVSTVAL